MFLYKYKKRQLFLQYIFRKLYKKIFNYLIVLKILIKNKFIEPQQKILAIFYCTHLKKINFKSWHKNICLYTGNKRSINLFFKLNRMELLDNLDNLIIPGIKRAIW